MPRRSPKPATAKSPTQVRRSIAERRANEAARDAGRPLPHPSPWDVLDPTKVPRNATDEQIRDSYLRFRALCPPRPRKKIEW